MLVWSFIDGPGSSLAIFLEKANHGSQPSRDRLFDLVLGMVAIKGIQGIASFIEWNVSARDFLRTTFWWNQLHQNTGATRVRILLRIVVHARERVFENIERAPRRLGRTPITAVLEEFKFKFKYL